MCKYEAANLVSASSLRRAHAFTSDWVNSDPIHFLSYSSSDICPFCKNKRLLNSPGSVTVEAQLQDRGKMRKSLFKANSSSFRFDRFYQHDRTMYSIAKAVQKKFINKIDR